MYNARLILPGLIVFILVIGSPVWCSWLGCDYTATDVVLPPDEKNCIEDLEFMRANHMRLLNEWRDQALRKSDRRTYQSALDGRKWPISLQKTCLKCHEKYSEFCQRCHMANSVYPYCWTCHILPDSPK